MSGELCGSNCGWCGRCGYEPEWDQPEPLAFDDVEAVIDFPEPAEPATPTTVLASVPHEHDSEGRY